MYSVHFFSGWLTTSNISEETLRGSQYLENLQASYNDDNDGGDDHGKSDKGPDTENVTDMANKIFETQLADSGKKYKRTQFLLCSGLMGMSFSCTVYNVFYIQGGFLTGPPLNLLNVGR